MARKLFVLGLSVLLFMVRLPHAVFSAAEFQLINGRSAHKSVLLKIE